MQSGQEKYGMQTFNQSLAKLYFTKQISMETAMIRSSMPDELTEMINRVGLTSSGSRPQLLAVSEALKTHRTADKVSK